MSVSTLSMADRGREKLERTSENLFRLVQHSTWSRCNLTAIVSPQSRSSNIRIKHMQPEIRLEILKEIEAVKKRLEEPAMFYKKSLSLAVIAAFLTTIVGIYASAVVIAAIAKHGVSYKEIAMLFVAIVLIASQWYFIARHQFDKRLLLVYEALLSNNSKTAG
jgi:K+-sensing histidine kinase KdpD